MSYCIAGVKIKLFKEMKDKIRHLNISPRVAYHAVLTRNLHPGYKRHTLVFVSDAAQGLDGVLFDVKTEFFEGGLVNINGISAKSLKRETIIACQLEDLWRLTDLIPNLEIYFIPLVDRSFTRNKLEQAALQIDPSSTGTGIVVDYCLPRWLSNLLDMKLLKLSKGRSNVNWNSAFNYIYPALKDIPSLNAEELKDMDFLIWKSARVQKKIF